MSFMTSSSFLIHAFICREIGTYTKQMANVQSNMTSMFAQLPTPCSGVCATVSDDVTAINSTLAQLLSQIGRDTNGDGNFESGLLQEISCIAINGK
jgi:hypothetical protein